MTFLRLDQPMQIGVGTRRVACIAAIVGAMIGVAGATAAGMHSDARERGSFDEVTGRNLLNYPPHRVVDLRHMRLAVRIPDMNRREMQCEETLTLSPIVTECAEFLLNGALLDIRSAAIIGRTVTFASNPEDETVLFKVDPPLQRGQVVDMTVTYGVSNAPEGLMWTFESADRPGLAAQIHTQGQSECNRYWFLSHDFPNARMTTELLVTVPHGYQVVSNGKLIEHTGDTEETYHWRLDRAHPSYLVSMVVGKFDRVDVGTSALSMPVYVPPGQGGRVNATFGRTPRMIELFARLAEEPFPWPQYAQTSVRNFEWGGMENTGATTLYETIALDQTALLDGAQDGLIAHELAHQWFGDLITCKSWEHVWLNEGFATYFEKVWAQYRESSIPSRGRGIEGLKPDNDEYQSLIWEDFRAVIEADKVDAPVQPAMASKEYLHPDEVFDRAANPYAKGAAVLHMLRERLGDEVFWRAVRAYVDGCKDKSVETFQFRQALERASGTSLQRFFDQWVFRPGVPHITATPTWDEASNSLTVHFKQTQPIDGYNPAFALDIPIWIRCAGERAARIVTASFDTCTGAASVILPSEPELVVIDPELAVLAQVDVIQPADRTIAQLHRGPTLAAKLRAAELLGLAPNDGQADAVAALASILNDSRSHRGLRLEAARSLGRLSRPSDRKESDNPGNLATATRTVASQQALTALVTFASAGGADPRVDRVVIDEAARAAEAADATDREALAAALVRRFGNDKSYAVRAACIRGLGTVKASERMDVVLAALGADSQHDQIRLAAVEALGAMDRPESIAPALRATLPCNSSDLRHAATTALGKLAHHDPDTVIPRLEALLTDPEPKTATAAGEALAELRTPRARAALQAHALVARGRTARHHCREWIKKASQPTAVR